MPAYQSSVLAVRAVLTCQLYVQAVLLGGLFHADHTVVRPVYSDSPALNAFARCVCLLVCPIAWLVVLLCSLCCCGLSQRSQFELSPEQHCVTCCCCGRVAAAGCLSRPGYSCVPRQSVQTCPRPSKGQGSLYRAAAGLSERAVVMGHGSCLQSKELTSGRCTVAVAVSLGCVYM